MQAVMHVGPAGWRTAFCGPLPLTPLRPPLTCCRTLVDQQSLHVPLFRSFHRPPIRFQNQCAHPSHPMSASVASRPPPGMNRASDKCHLALKTRRVRPTNWMLHGHKTNNKITERFEAIIRCCKRRCINDARDTFDAGDD